MNPSTSLTPKRAVEISGITISLEEQLKYSLHVKLNVDGTVCSEVSLKQGTTPKGNVPLHAAINIQEESVVTIEVQERHRVQRYKNRTLTQLSLSLSDILLYLDSTACGDPTKYPIRLSEPKKKIWLDVAVVSTLPGIPPDDTAQTPLDPKNVLDHSEMTDPLGDALQNLRTFKSALDRLGQAREPLDKALKIARAVSELHPIAKAVVACVTVVYDEFNVQDRHHKEILALAKNMAQTLTLVPVVEDVAKLRELKDTIETFPDLLNDTISFITRWLNSEKSNFFNADDNQSKIDGLKNRYNVFKEAFDRGVAIDSAVKVDDLRKSQELEDLKVRLGSVLDSKPRADKCMEGTRINILSNIEDKVNDLEDNNIIWVYGAPGSGKSSVSLTIKSRLHKQGRLVTYFRFDRNEATLTTSLALWSRVAYDLANLYPPVLKNNLLLLRENKVDLTSTKDLFTSLIQEPLLHLTDHPPDHPLVIVIDAVDECGGLASRSSSDRKALLQTLQCWPHLPKYFKLIVTSREEGDITCVLSSISTPIEIPSGHFLTENPHTDTSIHATNDLRTFLEARFRDIRDRFPSLPADWPGADIIIKMVSQAAGIFMWVTTAVNFIDCRGIDLQGRLRIIIGDAPESGVRMKPLYSLYTTILEMSFADIASDGPEAEVLHAVLGTMVLAKQPLSDREYVKLPTTEPITQAMLLSIRDSLRSVISQGSLRFLHKSFDDFLLSEECPRKYAIRMDEVQRLLTRLCLMSMTADLRFNICNLEDSCLRNVDVPDIETKVRDGIPDLLSYSCRFWADHLIRTPFNESLMSAVKTMIFDKLLYWFEVMSLLKDVNRVSHSLLLVLNWSIPTSDSKLKDFLRDARQFIRAFIYPIAQSAPHIYISALPFAPEQSYVSRHFLPRFAQILALSMGKPAHWPPHVFTSEHKGAIASVAFSPDEKYFVSGSYDTNICISDSETGSLISGPFQGTSCVLQVIYDPDGQTVWATCHDGYIVGFEVETGERLSCFRAWGSEIGFCGFSGGRTLLCASKIYQTVTFWNADTGQQQRVLPVPFDNSMLSKVAFSPDGSYMAWAGEDNTTIRIWTLVEGIEICGSHPRPDHSERISALSFSVDGPFGVSASSDGSILIWSAETGAIIAPPLNSGNVWVNAVAYSHKNGILVSAFGSPGSVTVWNTLTREAILGPFQGHTSSISTITLSQDCQRALTTSWDKAVRMWDLGRKGAVLTTRATKDHTDPVRCVAFSPCRKRLASLAVGCEKTIHVWDTHTGELLLSLSCLAEYNRVVFSPDCNQILAFGSPYFSGHDPKDATIQVWYANTGELAFYQDLHNDSYFDPRIDHLAFQSDQHLITCSRGCAVRFWRLGEDAIREVDFESRSQREFPWGRIEIIALSHDGLTAMVRDDDRNPRHYMWSTTTYQPLPLTFPDDKNTSKYKVSYSPSGRFFAAASQPSGPDSSYIPTLQVWDTRTGAVAAGPLVLDSTVAYLAFSQNDYHIAFSYHPNYSSRPEETDDKVIWIWDARTGQIASGPWHGHTDAISALAFSSDGERFVSVSYDGQIRIWDSRHLGTTTGFLGVGVSMQDGWVIDADGRLLFWVPKDHRSSLLWPGCVKVIGGGGIPTKLDLNRFRYGRNWTKCFGNGNWRVR